MPTSLSDDEACARIVRAAPSSTTAVHAGIDSPTYVVKASRMGYSHGWGRQADIPDEEFLAWCSDVANIIRAARPRFGFFGGVRIRGPSGLGRPRTSPARISLNGSYLLGQAHETFIVCRRYAEYRPRARPADDGLYWDACKTNQKPYDIVVVGAILALLHRVSRSGAETDGGPDEWRAGADLFQRALNVDPSPYLSRVFRSGP
jgi:hypothetical protein